MDDGKKKLLIHEDESGLELSLGLSLGTGAGSSSLERKSPAPAATVAADGDSHEEEWNARNNHSGASDIWMRKMMMQMQQQQQQQQHQQQRLREFLATDLSPQQQMAAAAWRQMSHGDPSGSKLIPSGMPLSMGDLAKYLGAGKSMVSSSALGGHQPQQQQQQSQGQSHDDDDDPDSAEQQKKMFQHQEARKKRKMLIDEQKQQKKAKDDDKPDGTDGASASLPHIQRTPSLSSFQNHQATMATLASQLLRRTMSDAAQGSSKDDGNPPQEPAEAARAVDSTDETKQLLGMWQLGTTVDMPSAESINPELSSLRPGTVAGQIGGTGSSPDLPWVSASGAGGKTINGVAYKLFQGQFKIVCSCHGLHMTPSDFVKHAESLDGGSNGVKGLGDSMSVMSQVAPA